MGELQAQFAAFQRLMVEFPHHVGESENKVTIAMEKHRGMVDEKLEEIKQSSLKAAVSLSELND